MNTVARILFFSLLLTLGQPTLADAAATVRQRALALDQQVDVAFYDEANVEYLENILTDNFIYAHTGAKPIQTKSETLKSLPPPGVWSQRERTGMDVRLHGHTAIVSGFFTVKLQLTQTFKFHMQRVYVQEISGWKLAAQHVTFNLSEEEGLLIDVTQYISDKYWTEK